MYHSLLAHLSLILLLSHLTVQTNIEYWDSDTVDPTEAHIIQKFRFLSGGECCVPVDLAFPQTGRIERFLPYKIVFEYFSKDLLFVYANANNEPACRGPPVGFYQQDDRPQRPTELVKDFVRTPNQRWTGALFLRVLDADDDNNVNGTSSSATDVANGNETESRNILQRPPTGIVYPWSISYRGLVHYEAPRGSLDYIDINGRSRIRGFPQFDPRITRSSRADAPFSQLCEPCIWLLGFYSIMANGYLSWETHVSKLFGLRQASDRRSKRDRLLQRTRDTEDESG